MYYDYNKILSYNVPVNILIGERGVGKTYGAKKFVINQFLKKGNKFLYLRRYKEERKKALAKFFTDVGEEFQDTELKVKGDNFYINQEIAGYSAVLTQAQDYKGSAYTDVKNIIFDEYPIEKNKRYYLPGEGMIIMGMLDSFLRNRSDVKIFILGNATNDIEYSPLFTFFNLELPYNNDIRLFKENTILVQYMRNDEFRENRRNTLIGKLASGTEYEQYAIENKILNKNNDFIEKKKGTATFYFTFIWNDEYYGVWRDFKEGKVFVSQDYSLEGFVFSLTLQDKKPNTMLISHASSLPCWKFFIDQFKQSNVYFENQKIKHISHEVVKRFSIK